MTSSIYNDDRASMVRPLYRERDLLMSERFYPGEFGWVVILAVASLLVYSLAIWGLLNDDPNPLTMNMSNFTYDTSYAYPSDPLLSPTTPGTGALTSPTTTDTTNPNTAPPSAY
jgi:hypothetical protein